MSTVATLSPEALRRTASAPAPGAAGRWRIADIEALFAAHGHRQYAGEPVTQLEHALQSGHRAELEGASEELEAVNHPDDPAAGTRRITFGRELFIEHEDFMENPPKKFFRLSPGTEVRLRYAYFIKCREVVKNAAGEIVELRCTYDPATKGGNAPDGRKVKATMHWVSAAASVPAEVRIYNQLFTTPSPDAANFAADLNPDSLEVVEARVEPAIAEANSPEPMQFERQGYFTRDLDSRPGRPVVNRTVGLRDTYAKEGGQGAKPKG